jgi:CRP-like cAMP-binding protein
MGHQSLAEILKEVYFLHDLRPEYVEQIAKVARLRDYDALKVVFREGELAQRVYLIAAGNVALEMCAPSVGCKRIMTVGTGELLGWSGFLGPERLTATARTLEPTQLVEVDARQLLSMCERNSALGYELMRRAMRAVSARLSATRMQLIDVYGSQMPTGAHAEGDADDR